MNELLDIIIDQSEGRPWPKASDLATKMRFGTQTVLLTLFKEELQDDIAEALPEYTEQEFQAEVSLWTPRLASVDIDLLSQLKGEYLPDESPIGSVLKLILEGVSDDE